MEMKQLTQEEIEILKKLQSSQIDIVNKLGNIEYQIYILSQKKHKVLKELDVYKEEENKVGDLLQSKYGDGTINLDKGEFISG